MGVSDARGLSERRHLGHRRSQITPLPDQVGAAFIVRGRLVGAELFDSPRTFAQLLPKLVRSYGLDALDHSLPRVSAPAAVDGEFQAFLEQLLGAATLRRPAVGLGEDLRIEAKELVAAALVHEGKVVHLSAFVKEESVRPPAGSVFETVGGGVTTADGTVDR
jgi:hypothetical protein